MGSPALSGRNNGQRLGITDPISLSGPTEYDVIKTRELEKYLQDAGLYESQEEAVSREEVLGRLDQIVKIWVKAISRAKGLNEQLVQEANAKCMALVQTLTHSVLDLDMQPVKCDQLSFS
ncbi:nuclear poly(A) polymerase 1-like [Momordica charantia]|uniref:Nuclear poly(A) polymerase 1-like n=1 Tax=Momordica charantia TaxID=3673 RepID=A0A6J1C694_MOMCH|nr:nuclear poly(A) polymerase 1-like [Momordica charantia]